MKKDKRKKLKEPDVEAERPKDGSKPKGDFNFSDIDFREKERPSHDDTRYQGF